MVSICDRCQEEVKSAAIATAMTLPTTTSSTIRLLGLSLSALKSTSKNLSKDGMMSLDQS